MAEVQKMRFLDAFKEDKNEVLTLQVNLKIGDGLFESGRLIRKGERINGFDFHAFRYLDLAVELEGEDVFLLKGFLPPSTK
jgi:hypothetical protein